MKMPLSFALLLALSCAICRQSLAGVIMTQETVSNSMGGRLNDSRTVMIEDHKQKLVMNGQTVLIDLDQGHMTLLNSSNKTYSELPFPPTGQMARMMSGLGAFNLDFQNTGITKTVAGYKCSQYTGSSHTTMGNYSVKGCFSTSAPGADEYAAFTDAMLQKLKQTAIGLSQTHPPGIPLELETTTKITNLSIPGMPPGQAEAIRRMMANRPPTTITSTTTSIKVADLPAGTFSVPSDYTEREIRLPTRGMGSKHPMMPNAAPTPYEGE